MNEHIERIMRDMEEMLEKLYDAAYQAGLSDQKIEDIERINEAYDRGADESSNESKKGEKQKWVIK
jgi:hypothetical protein